MKTSTRYYADFDLFQEKLFTAIIANKGDFMYPPRPVPRITLTPQEIASLRGETQVDTGMPIAEILLRRHTHVRLLYHIEGTSRKDPSTWKRVPSKLAQTLYLFERTAEQPRDYIVRVPDLVNYRLLSVFSEQGCASLMRNAKHVISNAIGIQFVRAGHYMQPSTITDFLSSNYYYDRNIERAGLRADTHWQIAYTRFLLGDDVLVDKNIPEVRSAAQPKRDRLIFGNADNTPKMLANTRPSRHLL